MVGTMKLDRKSLFKEVRDYVMITIAMLSYCIGWTVFLLPNNITTGGVPGIASIIYWGAGLPVQITYFGINAILMVLALRILGLKFCIKTIYGILVLTFALDVAQRMTAGSHLLNDQPFMAAVIGAAFCGCGVGLGLSSNGSTGGTDIVAAIINKYRDISLGRVILICDLIIISCSYFVLHDWERVIYGYVVLIITSFCIDQVVNSMRRSVQFFIIVASIFLHFGITFIYAVAGITGIPVETFEAAEIDGANRLQTFFRITLPSMRPMLFFITVVSVVDGLGMYDVPSLFGAYDTTRSNLTLMMYMQNQAFQGSYAYDRASAASLIMLAIYIIAAVIVYFVLLRDKDEIKLKRQRRQELRELKRGI